MNVVLGHLLKQLGRTVSLVQLRLFSSVVDADIEQTQSFSFAAIVIFCDVLKPVSLQTFLNHNRSLITKYIRM